MAPTAQVRGAVLIIAAIAAIAVVSCSRDKSPAVAGSAVQGTSVARRRVESAAIWDNALGPVLASPSIENGAPVLFLRDTTSTSDIDVELFNHAGETWRATLGQLTVRRGCPWERSAVVSSPVGGAAIAWALAFAPGVAAPIAVDGISDLLPRDSASLAAQIHRLVNAVPDDSLSAPFRGLPIVVRDAWQFQLEDGTTIAVAVATRALNVESNPRGEVTSIVAERDPRTGEWRTGFVRRDAGSEDRVEGADLLAAFRLHGAQPAVAFAYEGEKGLLLDIVERTAPGTWRPRWSSAGLPCAR